MIFKKVFAGILICFMMFAITGCGKEEGFNPENIFNNDTENSDNDNESSDGEADIKLYSDDTKLVFNFSGVYQIVYYYSGDKITGLEYYYNYGDSATAKYAVSAIKANYTNENNIKSVEQKGKYIIVKFEEGEYKDQTVEEIKQTYSYLEQIYENNEEK